MSFPRFSICLSVSLLIAGPAAAQMSWNTIAKLCTQTGNLAGSIMTMRQQGVPGWKIRDLTSRAQSLAEGDPNFPPKFRNPDRRFAEEAIRTPVGPSLTQQETTIANFAAYNTADCIFTILSWQGG